MMDIINSGRMTSTFISVFYGATGTMGTLLKLTTIITLTVSLQLGVTSTVLAATTASSQSEAWGRPAKGDSSLSSECYGYEPPPNGSPEKSDGTGTR